MSLTKAVITAKIQNKLGVSSQDAYDIMEEFLEIMKQDMESGNDILVSGFGKFCVNKKDTRRGRNPATNTAMILPQRRVVIFQCSRKLRNLINS